MIEASGDNDPSKNNTKINRITWANDDKMSQKKEKTKRANADSGRPPLRVPAPVAAARGPEVRGTAERPSEKSWDISIEYERD